MVICFTSELLSVEIQASRKGWRFGTIFVTLEKKIPTSLQALLVFLEQVSLVVAFMLEIPHTLAMLD